MRRQHSITLNNLCYSTLDWKLFFRPILDEPDEMGALFLSGSEDFKKKKENFLFPIGFGVV